MRVSVEAPDGQGIEGTIVDGTWNNDEGGYDLGEPFRVQTDEGELVWCKAPWCCDVELITEEKE